MLDTIDEQFCSVPVWGLVDLYRKLLPEWKDPSGFSLTIEPEEILHAAGIPQDEITRMIEDARELERPSALGLRS